MATGQWNTWADVPAYFKQETYNSSVPFWDNDQPGNSWARREVPGMPEPAWNDPSLVRPYTADPNLVAKDYDNPLDTAQKSAADAAWKAGDVGSYYYDAGYDDRFALRRNPDGSFYQVEVASDQDFTDQAAKYAAISLGGAYLGGSLMGGVGGAAGAGGAAEGMTAAEAWGSGAGLGGDTLTAMGMGEAGAGAGMAGTGMTAAEAWGTGAGLGGDTLSAMGVSDAAVGGGGLLGGASSGGGLTAGQVATGGSMASSLIPGISNEALLKVGGSLLGGALGGQDSTQTASRDPWGPSQEWLKSNLQTGQKLQDYYQQNPFNQQQKTSYQNLFNGIDGYNQSMPGLLNFANNAMGSNYQRQRGGEPGSGAGYGGNVQPGGLLRGPGAFVAPQTQANAPIDWNAQNPFKRG
jgi:hypothetical protein